MSNGIEILPSALGHDLTTVKYYAMILREVLGTHIDDAANRLRQAGYRCIGRGTFGQVWAKPKDPYVVKLTTSRAHIKFLSVIQNHQDNPHFPRIKGQVMPFYHWWGVRIERLTRVAPPDVTSQISRLATAVSVANLERAELEQAFKAGGREAQWHDWYQHNLNIYQAAQADMPSVVEAMEIIAQEITKPHYGSWDFNPGNLRMRSGIIVFSDPVC